MGKSYIEVDDCRPNENGFQRYDSLSVFVGPNSSKVLHLTQIFTITAKSEHSLVEASLNLRKWAARQDQSGSYLRRLAFTLARRRSLMYWRYAFIASTHEEIQAALDPQALRRTKTASHNRLVFVFTGQGAQWPRMAQRLLSACTVFKDSVLQSAAILEELGATWNVFEELNRDEATSRLEESEIGQPATTILQIALIETLQSWNITPNIVLGHSSGEIAAAYTAGALNKRSAVMVSYYRGFLARRCKEMLKANGSMLVVALGEQGLESYISQLTTGRVQVACLNSPTSSTVSGDEGAILELERLLDWSSIGHQRLKVDTAYHSHHMGAVAEAYNRDLKNLSSTAVSSSMKFYSSVTTEEKISGFGAAYWVENLVSKVCFLHAVENICQTMRCDRSTIGASSYHTFVEIGPHTTLIRPVKQILTHLKLENFQGDCITTLIRNRDSLTTLLQTAATLFTTGFPVDLVRANSSANYATDSDFAPINDLPPYPWNHLSSYWHESRLSREHRLRPHPYHDLLGLRSLGSLDLDPTWRHTLRADDLPWLKDHRVEGRIVYPGSAYIAMVIEAKKQMLLGHPKPSKIKYHILKDVVFQDVLVIPEAPEIVEIQLSLHAPLGTRSRDTIAWEEFRVCSIARSGEVSEHCYGKVRLEAYPSENHTVTLREAKVDYMLDTGVWDCRKLSKTALTSYDPKRIYRRLQARGNYWGPSFALIREFDATECNAVGTVEVGHIAKCMPEGFMQPHTIHPATLDALLHSTIFLWGLSGGRDITLPVRVGEIKISADVVVDPGKMLTFETKIYPQNDSSTRYQVYAYHEGQHPGLHPCIQIRDGELRAAVRSRYPATGSPSTRDLCYQVEWDIDLDFCNPSINTASLVAHGGGKIPIQRRLERLNTIARDYMRDCSLNITRDEIEKRHLRYYDWMTGHLQLQSRRDAAHARPILSPQALSSPDVEEELLNRVGSNLTAVLKGTIDPLALLLENSLISRMYSEDRTIRNCYSHLIIYLKGVIFKNPNMKMLEIGAGTGGLTVPFLQSIASDGKLPLYIYVFTDISSGYFKDARQKLATWADQIQYKTLDIGEGPAKQGLEEGSFDLVLASNALHVTKNVDEALMNARRLLKPRGRLVFIETTRLQLFTSMTFGVLPGWFLGRRTDITALLPSKGAILINRTERHDGREDTPMLSTEQWHEHLLRSSFAGVDLAKSDNDGHDGRMTMMVTRATCMTSVSQSLGPVSMFDCPTSREENRALSKSITQALVTRSIQFLEVFSPLLQINPEAIYIIMDSTEHPLVTAADYGILETLKGLLLKATKLLWITSAKDATTTTNHGVDWISDVVLASRSENLDLKLVTIMVERSTEGNTVATASDQICKIFQESFCTASDLQILETKYFLGDGRVLIPRLKPNVRFQQRRQRTADPDRTPVLFHQPGLNIRLAIQKTEREPKISFDVAPSHSNPISSTDIEIQVAAYGLNPDKVELLPGPPQILNVDKMIGECAGNVTAIGAAFCHQFSLGDRVCAWGEVPCASRIRVNGNNVTHVPSTITSQVGASIPLAFLSAYYSLVVLAQITTSSSVLIQDAADSSGQAAIQLSIDIGANVFAVVRNKEEQAFVLKMFSLPHDHVFLETQSFHRQVIELTHGQGVDINIALSGPLSVQTSKCVARFGKQIVKAGLELTSPSSQVEKIARNNTSLISFDLADLSSYDRQKETKLVMDKIRSMFEVKRLHPIHPFRNMDMAHIEEAFELAQKKDQFGKVVVTADSNTLVNCSPPKPSELNLCRNGTYILSGDFSDLGLEICKFMTLHGARHVLFANTLNTRVEAEQNLADVCRELGIHFQVISFDTTKETISEKERPFQRRGFAPVKGIFYGRMVQKVLRVINVKVVLADRWQTRLVEKTSVNELAQSLESSIETINWLYDSYWSPDVDFFLTLSSSKRLLSGEDHGKFSFGLSNNIKPRMMRDADARKFVQIDLSGMEDSCLKVSRLDSKDGLTREGLVHLTGADLSVILECAMSLTNSDHGGQRIIAGFDRLSIANSKNRSALDDPIFSHVGPLDTDQANTQLSQDSSVEEWSIKHVETREKARLIVTAALVQEIASHVAIEQSMIDTNTAIEDFGMDSLVQWDLRSYISINFEVDLSAKELANAESVIELAHLVVDRASIEAPNKQPEETDLEHEEPEVFQTELPLPRQPLPSLQDTLKALLDAVQPFMSDGEFEKTCEAVEVFQKRRGLGEQLQHRLVLRDGDPTVENWLTDLYTTHRFLRLRQTLVAHSSYFLSHPISSVSHGQAERAAVITLASLIFKQKLQSAQLPTQHLPMSGQPVDPTSYHWIFHTCREAHVEEDRINKHPTNDYVVVLRYGQFFKVNLSASTGNVAFQDLVKVFQQILDDTPKVESLVSVLTTGNRDMWAKVRHVIPFQ